MASKNKVLVAGNLTQDPVLEFVEIAGEAVEITRFGVAVHGYGENAPVHFIDVSAWRGQAKAIAAHKKKGDNVLIEGRLQYSSYTVKDGSARNKVDITAEDVQFLPKGGVTYNSVTLMGNLTRDPELRFTSSGVPVANVGLAVNNPRSRKENAVDYFDVTAWRELGEALVEHKAKGSPVLIDGRLEYSEYEAKDGSKRRKISIVAESIQYIGTRDDETARAAKTVKAHASTAVATDEDDEESYDDIPF